MLTLRSALVSASLTQQMVLLRPASFKHALMVDALCPLEIKNHRRWEESLNFASLLFFLQRDTWTGQEQLKTHPARREEVKSGG